MGRMSCEEVDGAVASLRLGRPPPPFCGRPAVPGRRVGVDGPQLVAVEEFHRECVRVAARLKVSPDRFQLTVKYVTVTRPGDGLPTRGERPSERRRRNGHSFDQGFQTHFLWHTAFRNPSRNSVNATEWWRWRYRRTEDEPPGPEAGAEGHRGAPWEDALGSSQGSIIGALPGGGLPTGESRSHQRSWSRSTALP